MTTHRIAVGVLALLLLLAAQTMATEVTNVALSHEQGMTVVRIDLQGQVRFTHSTEIPKNGKPDRIIVDILSATHELGAKEIFDLPQCGVTAIRSSQYAVTPEKVVRVVLDMSQAPVYRVASDDHSITLFINDKTGHPFEAWSTAAWLKAPVTPAVKPPVLPAAKPPTVVAKKQNDEIERDRQVSLAGDKPAPKMTTSTVTPTAKVSTPDKAPSVAKAPATKPAAGWRKPDMTPKPVLAQNNAPKATLEKAPQTKTYTPKMTPNTDANKSVPTVKHTPGQNPNKMAKVEKKSAPKTTGQSPKPSVTVAQKPAPAKQSPKNATKPAPTVAKTDKPKPAAKSAVAPKTDKPAKVAAKPAGKQADSNSPAKKSTSRFRRTGSSSRKIMGTMVAEFPKRLVIKYKASGNRDPFRTLVDATRTYDNPIEKRIPNIEGLKLVGVLESPDGGNRALFEDNENYGYMLKSGDKVRNGYVLRVESDRVYFQIFEYGWSRTVALSMESY